MRGRALGGWIFAVSFGWIGHLELGAVSDAIGVHWALAIHGVLTLVVAVVALSVRIAEAGMRRFELCGSPDSFPLSSDPHRFLALNSLVNGFRKSRNLGAVSGGEYPLPPFRIQFRNS